MTDDFRSSERDNAIVVAASRLARQISKALGARRGHRPPDVAERAAILREAFQYAAGAAPHGGADDPHA